MSEQAKKLKCPLCEGTIKKLAAKKATKDKRKNAAVLIKCEHNLFEKGKHTGCDFILDLAPNGLHGYQLSKEEVIKIIDGEELNIDGTKVTYNTNSDYNPVLVFPELQDY